MAALSERLHTADARPRVVAVCGPTGTGKTTLAVALSKRFGGEVISADSMQVYRGLDVGTAKATEAERQGVPHHLLDIRTPAEPFSVADFTAAASACIADITARGRLPVVAGGTGLYVTSLLEGIAFTPQKPDPARRAAWQRRAAEDGGEQTLWAELNAVDPATAAALHPHQTGRIIRALEVYHTTGRTMAAQQAAARPAQAPWRSLCLCLTCRDRANLYARLDARVDAMLQNGLLAEAERVWRYRDAYKTAAQAIGYKEFFPYFAGTATVGECTAALKRATRRYAKRQLTWFHHHGDPVWLYIDAEDVETKAAALVERFLH